MTERYDPPVCILVGGAKVYILLSSSDLYVIGASRATTQLASSTAVLDNTISFRSGPGAAGGVLTCQRRPSCFCRVKTTRR